MTTTKPSGPLLGRRAMVARDREEPHRASTPLELLFDLCFVVAVSQAAAALHHALVEGEVGHAVLSYSAVFFAIWWAWMNFTWFASAYDTDDVVYRLMTFVQIAGVLVLAAGVAAAFDGDFLVVTIGYVVMRVSMTAQWLRAAGGDPLHRQTAVRYAIVLVLTQTAWVLRLFLPDSAAAISFIVLVVVEVAGPYWAERVGNSTPWHPEHIAERYGLFTIIVLGECILSSFVAINVAITVGISSEIVITAVVGLLTVFAIWWTYFRLSADEMLREKPQLAFVWGYGHYFLFGSIAALGAGISVLADAAPFISGTTEHVSAVHLSLQGTVLAFAIPVAITMLMLAMLRSLAHEGGRRRDAVGYGSAVSALVIGVAGGRLGLTTALVLLGVVVVGRVVLDEVLSPSATDLALPALE